MAVLVVAILVCGRFGLSVWPFWSDLWPFWFVAFLDVIQNIYILNIFYSIFGSNVQNENGSLRTAVASPRFGATGNRPTKLDLDANNSPHRNYTEYHYTTIWFLFLVFFFVIFGLWHSMVSASALKRTKLSLCIHKKKLRVLLGCAYRVIL